MVNNLEALSAPRHPQGVALQLREVRFGFVRRPEFLGPVSVEVPASGTLAILGPNGAGKSTLLRLMAGLLVPREGSIHWDGRDLHALSARERARSIAFLPQRSSNDLDLTVREIVLMGRFPHRSMGLFESAEDHRIADRAMDEACVADLADRVLSTLSGGEAQRVHLAAALAQQPRLLLLDEPTASLDIEHQWGLFELLRRIAREHRTGVVVVTHDINLAARFCDRVLLLCDGKVAAQGPPVDVVTPGVLAPVYRVALESVASGGGAWVLPSARSVTPPR